jgi:hypothetical protein
MPMQNRASDLLHCFVGICPDPVVRTSVCWIQSVSMLAGGFA